MNKKLYIGFSYVEFFWALLLRVMFVAGGLYFFINYSENPVLMVVLGSICFTFLLFTGDDQIVVYEDRIIQTNSSIFSLFSKRKDKSIDIQQISTAYIEPLEKFDTSGFLIVAFLKFFVPKPLKYTTKANVIFFQLYNGNTITFETKLDHKKMRKIIEVVNFLVGNSSKTAIS